MGVKDILKRVFTKEKKIVITGLDSAGKYLPKKRRL